jgi:hypothetical protein
LTIPISLGNIKSASVASLRRLNRFPSETVIGFLPEWPIAFSGILTQSPASGTEQRRSMIAMWMLERLDGNEMERRRRTHRDARRWRRRSRTGAERQTKAAGEADLHQLLALFALSPSALRDEPLAESDFLVLADLRYVSKSVKTR